LIWEENAADGDRLRGNMTGNNSECFTQYISNVHHGRLLIPEDSPGIEHGPTQS